MKEPKLEWYSRVGSDEKFALEDDVYAGTYTGKASLVVELQLWNNRWGTEDVQPMEDFYINAYFKEKEDSSLFDCCKILLGEHESASFVGKGAKKTLSFEKEIKLSGTKNDGKTEGNDDHYIALTFIFNSTDGSELKENDLKSLYLEIVKNK